VFLRGVARRHVGIREKKWDKTGDRHFPKDIRRLAGLAINATRLIGHKGKNVHTGSGLG